MRKFTTLAIYALPAVLAGSLSATAQKLSLEKTHQVSGKAKRGFLDDVKVNEGANKVDLVFCTKATNRKVKFETYHFDREFNFLNMDASEEPVEKVKRYKGDMYDVPGVTVEPNMMGTLVLRRKQTHYTWDWLWGGYNKKVEILEKVKPRGDNGAFYQYSAHTDYDQTGNTVVVASAKDKLGKGTDPLRMYKEYHILKFNKDLDLVSDTPVQFDTPQYVVEINKLRPQGEADEDTDDSADPEYDLGVVFAPVSVGGKKLSDPQATRYTYLRAGADTKVRERVAVQSPNSVWLVNGMATFPDGTVAVFGPANDKPDKYFNEAIAAQVANEAVRGPLEDAFKAKNFELLKIKDGAVAYLTSTPVSEFEQKLQTPPGQRRTPEYTGKRFRVTNGQVLANGDLLIGGQSYGIDRKLLGLGAAKTSSSGPGLAGGLGGLLSGKGGTTMGTQANHRTYGDIMMFHFDPQGHLRAQYGLRRQENKALASQQPNEQRLYLTPDQRSMYWMVGEISNLQQQGGMESGTVKILYYPAVTKLDLASTKLTDVVKLGDEKYYLNNTMPELPMGGKNNIVYFGENAGGKTMWFAKLPLE